MTFYNETIQVFTSAVERRQEATSQNATAKPLPIFDLSLKNESK